MQAESTAEFHDVIIVGGGMVGGMLACALADRAKLRVAVLESHEPKPFPPGTAPEYDLRVSALSVAAQHMLENVGAWQGVLDRRACAFADMAVWDGEEHGHTHFRASDIGATALGHIVENRVLQLALLDRLHRAENVSVLTPAVLDRFRNDGQRVQLSLRDGSRLSCSLLVGADGARSMVRREAGITMERSTYDQHALVATVDTELPQQSITWQRFVSTGPQAMLPLCGNRASLVWYHAEDDVQRLLQLDDSAFIEAVHESFPTRLGQLVAVKERGSFPIAKAHASSYIASRVALIGDAAHTVHPLAGQGVNLGLLDAACLSSVVLDSLDRQRDIGDRRTLRRYERWRKSENALMIGALDTIHHAFSPQPLAVRKLRSAGLNAVNRVSGVRHMAMRHAMGITGDLPPLARPTTT